MPQFEIFRPCRKMTARHDYGTFYRSRVFSVRECILRQFLGLQGNRNALHFVPKEWNSAYAVYALIQTGVVSSRSAGLLA